MPWKMIVEHEKETLPFVRYVMFLGRVRPQMSAPTAFQRQDRWEFTDKTYWFGICRRLYTKTPANNGQGPPQEQAKTSSRQERTKARPNICVYKDLNKRPEASDKLEGGTTQLRRPKQIKSNTMTADDSQLQGQQRASQHVHHQNLRIVYYETTCLICVVHLEVHPLPSSVEPSTSHYENAYWHTDATAILTDFQVAIIKLTPLIWFAIFNLAMLVLLFQLFNVVHRV